jgi:hypothetical protein
LLSDWEDGTDDERGDSRAYQELQESTLPDLRNRMHAPARSPRIGPRTITYDVQGCQREDANRGAASTMVMV